MLTADGHGGATYELAGSEPLSQTEVAAAIGASLKIPVRAEAESVESWQVRARAGGMGEYECATLAAMFRYYAAHGLIGNSHVLASACSAESPMISQRFYAAVQRTAEPIARAASKLDLAVDRRVEPKLFAR